MTTILSGEVIWTGTGHGLRNARVEAWDTSGAITRPLGTAATRRGGVFSIVFGASAETLIREQTLKLELRVVGHGRFVRIDPAVTWSFGERADGLVLNAQLDRDGNEMEGARAVTGTVTLVPSGRPAGGIVVRAFDRDLRSEELLGETRTDKDGRYAISYTKTQFARAEKDYADLLVRVFDRDGKELLHEPEMEDIVFNAGADARVDIRLTREVPDALTEFERLLAMLAPLLGKTKLVELVEDEANRDIAFLARETEIAAEKLEHLVVAHRIGAAIKQTPAVFYALLRMDTLLDAAPLPLAPLRYVVTIHDDTRDVLLATALIDPERIKQDLTAAINARIVPEDAEEDLPRILRALKKLRPEAEANENEVLPKKVLELVEGLIEPKRLGELTKLLTTPPDDFTTFLEEIASGDWFKSDETAGTARARLGLAEVLGFDRKLLDEVGAAHGIERPEDLERLAALDLAAWRDTVRRVAPDLPDEVVALRATRLARRIEARHPTAAFRARLGNDEAPPVRNAAAVALLFETHGALRLERTNLDRFFRDNKLDSAKDREVLSDLKRVQRVMKLAPGYDRTKRLLDQNIHSAHSVVATGRSRFVGEVAPRAGMTEAEANATFERAVAVHSAAMVIAGDLRDIAEAGPAAVRPADLTAAMAEVMHAFPNLASLFHLTDHCTCTHCRSVLSPAAYLVELLEFLDRRDMVDLTQTPPVKVNLAKEVLLARRPDIADLDLNCANAETPLPFIDLVCELLEEEIAPDLGIAHNGVVATGVIPAALLATLQGAGWRITDRAIVQDADINGDLILRGAEVTAKLVNQGGNAWLVRRLRQTHGTAAELSAAPEYVNASAYTALATADYAFTLPFDLNHAEALAYFERFGLARADLMRHFATGGVPAPESIAGEQLGLTDAERALIVTTNPAGQPGIWNFPPVSTVSEMTVVDMFLNKTGITYDELNRLLQLGFIDQNGDLFIRHLDLTCDLTQKEVANLDAPALDRIHRFLRLQKATGWEDVVLDAMITQAAIGQGSLNDAALVRMAELERLAAKTGVKLDEWTGCFGEIPNVVMTGTETLPLYHRVFLNKAAIGYVEDALRPENVDGSGLLDTHRGTLAALLKLTADDFDRLLASLPNGQLTFANLSRLYATARLADRLKLSIADFLTLADLTAVDAFASPADALTFVEHHAFARLGPLKIPDVRFMLRHEAEDLAVREVTDEKVAELLFELQAVYQEAFTATRSAYDDDRTADESRAPVKEALLSLIGEDEANTVLRMYDNTWASPPDPNAAITLADLLGGFFDTMALAAAQNAVATAFPGTVEAARKVFADTLLAAIAAFHLDAAKAAALTEALAAFARQDVELVDVVLDEAVLGQPAPGTAMLADLLADDALIDAVNDPPNPPAINPAAFPEQFAAMRLLHKLLPFAASLDLPLEDLAWLLEHAGDLGWLRLDDIPYQAGQAVVAHADWEHFTRVLSLFATYKPVPDPADSAVPVTFASTLENLLPGSATTRAEWLDVLALLTGHARQTLDNLDARFTWSAPNLDAWRQAETWEWMARCMADLRSIGATVAEATGFSQPVLTAAETTALRIALKTRYDDTIWLTTLGEITNALRPQKRDALVAFLLAERPKWRTPTDLYDHFLIDVEMEAKMPSSRIVQAHGAIQLFVERGRMGLEPEAATDTTDVGWEQWKWMRNYRVWEANRKVFIYPQNWIEPELLDDKSFLFENLENELLQNEVNEFTAEDAFINYLEALDDISFLEVVAVYYQADIYSMHVFARTKGGDPAQYYHRKFEKERYWTPWKLVELDITSDNLLTFVRNNRLHLAWPLISEETNPDQDTTTPSVSESPSTGPMQHPEARLKIQLAVSEFANGMWKPKKISQDAIVTPLGYTTDTSKLDQTKFNLIYNQFADHIWLFHTSVGWDTEFHTLDGVFNVTGCKGYPELLSSNQVTLPDFFPDYKDTLLRKQRYFELGWDATDNLAIRNMITFWGFVERLAKTPGRFRVTHPHQFTLIDLIYVLLQSLFWGANHDTLSTVGRMIKIPFGTWLPYFFEDSNRAYTIIPGLYAQERGGETKRTYSDILKLIEDIIALIVKYLAKLNATPAPDPADVLAELAVDPDYLHILDEWEIYGSLRFGEQFKNLYHPLICPLRKTLYKHGVGRMMARDQQLQVTSLDFESTFGPNPLVVAQLYPIEDVDFNSDGSYSLYNWELFFHAPLMIAKRLASEQRFEEAMVWYHRIFDPTGTLEGTVPQKYWVTKPFFLTADADYVAQRIDTLLSNVADPNAPERHELEFAIEEWRTKPFRPHAVARFRTVAYQKTVVMNYLGTLIDWADYLFRQDTMESITQATQLYVLADKLLGPKPQNVPSPVEMTDQTYNQIVADVDAFGNALIELENILPDLSVLPEGGAELPPPPVTLTSLYFCIPPNEKMQEYWDTIADRLFKIRNSQNIEGIERVLALFAPPIDPGMLVRAVAAGLDLSAVLAGLNAPLPPYRFQIMAGKATELAQEVRQLGNALLAALEKKDAEAMALLRNDLETQLLNAQRDLKVMEIDASAEQIEVLTQTRAVTEERNAFYEAFERINAAEQLNLDMLGEAQDFQTAAGIVRAVGAVLGIIPDFSFGGHGAGGSPAIHATFGGSTLATVAEAAASVLNILSGVASYEAGRAGTLGGFDRRMDEAQLQARLSDRELAQIDQQIVAAELRKEISEKDLAAHDVQIQNTEKISATLEDKYTNVQLYQWMINQITSVYYRAYQLAYDTATRAERCYQHELGSTDTFLSFGYWDSRKKGLQSANKLLYDLKRMEAGYLEANRREYELTKHVSLRQLDPLALVRLTATAACDFEIPEALYDMDHPGQYFRRIKSVSISIPCVAGPYTSVSGRLTQITNRYRKSTARAAGAGTPKEEYEEAPGNDTRFVYNVGSSQSVATSSGQNDAGLFELNFRDDRYLPFEGTGAVGTWRLDLPDEVRQFDYSTISDVVVHVRYTAREGGGSLRGLAVTSLTEKLQEIAQGLAKTGLHVLVDLKRDYFNEWHELKSTGTTNLTIGRDRLPYFTQALAPAIGTVTLLARVAGDPAAFNIGVDGANVSLNFSPDWRFNLADHAGPALETPMVLTVAPAELAALEGLSLIIKIDFT